MKKTPCKKPCESNSESSEIRIVWDHEISEKIYELEAKILSSSILLVATFAVGISNIIATLLKK